MTPLIGPKKDPKVSIKESIPIWLNKVGQNIATIKPKKPIVKLTVLKLNMLGLKLINEYWDGIKFAIKLVDADAIIIKNKTITVTCKLSNLPIMSVGLVNIFSISLNCCFKKISDPVTINTANIENIIRFTNKHKFPFFNSI